MEIFLLIVILLVLIIIIGNLKSSVHSRFDHLQKKIDDLKDELANYKGEGIREKTAKKSILADEILPQVLESKAPVPIKKPEEKKKGITQDNCRQ